MFSKVFCCCLSSSGSLKTKIIVIAALGIIISSFSIFTLQFGNRNNYGAYGNSERTVWTMKVPGLILGLIIHSSLMYGACRGSKRFLMPYITSFGSGILIFPVLSSWVLYIYIAHLGVTDFVIYSALLSILILTAMVYSWMTVYNHYIELAEIKFRGATGHIYGSSNALNDYSALDSKDV